MDFDRERRYAAELQSDFTPTRPVYQKRASIMSDSSSKQLGTSIDQPKQPYRPPQRSGAFFCAGTIASFVLNFPVPCCVGSCACRASAGRRGSCPTGQTRPSSWSSTAFAEGTVYRETEVERADLETIIADLMSGQFNDPIRVVAFNTLSIGRRTSQNISPSKFKPTAISKAPPSPSTSETS
jgi:hypothetical protein